MLTYLAIALLIAVLASAIFVASRNDLVELLTKIGHLLASPFEALLFLLESLAHWLIRLSDHAWASLSHHRGPEDKSHLIMDCVVAVFATAAMVLLAFTDLALTMLTLGPIFGLSIPFSDGNLVLYLSCSFLVAIALVAYAAWEFRPHHDEDAVPATHSTPFGAISERLRDRLFRGMLALAVVAAVVSIVGMIWRIQAHYGVDDPVAAAIFLIGFAVLVACALAIATVLALRSPILIAALVGEVLLVGDWLTALLPWLVIRVLDAAVAVLVCIVDWGASLGAFAILLVRKDAKLPDRVPRQPISVYVPFPRFIFRRRLPAEEDEDGTTPGREDAPSAAPPAAENGASHDQAATEAALGGVATHP